MMRLAKAATLAGLVLAMTATVMLPASAADEAAARCDEGHWQATVQGVPGSFTRGGAAGYYVWHDSNGWHLRTTTPQRNGHPFSGTITSSGNIGMVRQYQDEGRDSITVRGHSLSFSFDTHNGVDGVDFTVGCTESLGLSLKAYNRLVPTSRIWLGQAGNARANPFSVHRVA